MHKYGVFLLFFISFLCFPELVSAKEYYLKQSALYLSEAENLALQDEPTLGSLDQKAQALEQTAVADGQLDDPQAMFGLINVPTNNFALNQEDMTMVMVGVQQTFPRGHSLADKSLQMQAQSRALHIRTEAQTRVLIQNVRTTWLDIYYLNRAAAILHKNQATLNEIVKTVRTSYSVGRQTQTDVLQAELESNRLIDEDLKIKNQQGILRAQLARWIGENAANRPLAETLPHWEHPPSLSQLQMQLACHPLLRADQEDVQAKRAEVAYAEEQFKPGWMLGLSYGFRQGHMDDGSSRPDMVTAQVTVDLPIFPSQRENKRLNASTHELLATQLTRDAQYRDLNKSLTSTYNTWLTQSKQLALYRKKFLPLAVQNAKAAFLAYQNAKSGLNSVLRSRLYSEAVQLQTLKLEIDVAKSRAALFYLQGCG